MSAAGEGNEEIVRLLLERGANIDAANDVSVRFIVFPLTAVCDVCVCDVCVVCVWGEAGSKARSSGSHIRNMKLFI
jgi:ankyrin repeat protein